MALEFLNDAYFAAKVGIGVEVPTYTLELQVCQPDENPVVYSQFGGNDGVRGNSFYKLEEQEVLQLVKDILIYKH